MTLCSSKAGESSKSLMYRMKVVISNFCVREWLCSKVSSVTHMDLRQQSKMMSSFLNTRSLQLFHFQKQRLSSCQSGILAGSFCAKLFKRLKTVLFSLGDCASLGVYLLLDAASEVCSFLALLWLMMKSLMALSSQYTVLNYIYLQSLRSMSSSIWLYSPNSLPLRQSLNWQNSLTVMAPPVRILMSYASLMSRSLSTLLSC